MSALRVYSVGICCASVCAPAEMERDEVELTNLEVPSGVGPWRVSEDPTFSSGEPNPYVVEGCGRHWLLNC